MRPAEKKLPQKLDVPTIILCPTHKEFTEKLAIAYIYRLE